jgi:glycosyltransferase involved in cell wall biosynthesis
MRIALLAPLVAPIAPPFLGGAQALLADLASGLAARGHQVTLYAADGSQAPGVQIPSLGIDSTQLTPANFSGQDNQQADDEDEDDDESGGLVPVDHAAYLSDYAFLRAYRAIADHARDYDLVHAHAYDVPAFSYASITGLPVVHTLHLPPLDAGVRDALATLAPPHSSMPTRLVTVSQACAALYAPFCRIDAVIYNGIRVEQIPFGAQPAQEPYLLYAGRITPEKGVEDALEIARRTGKRLLLAGGVYDQHYFAQHIEPLLQAHPDEAQYLGAIPHEELWRLMAGAEALLVPSHWDEPFGLVACEAQAAGTPVVAYARGGLREVVADGVTGWLVPPDDQDAAVTALGNIAALDRAACRLWVSERFSLDTMLDAYELFYQGMLD